MLAPFTFKFVIIIHYPLPQGGCGSPSRVYFVDRDKAVEDGGDSGYAL